MPNHEPPRPAGRPKLETRSSGAPQGSLPSTSLLTLRQEIEIIEHAALFRQMDLISGRVECARRRLDDLAKMGPLVVSEPVWVYQRLQMMINGNADIAIDVYHKLSELVEQGAHLCKPVLVESRLEQARTQLDSLAIVGDVPLNEPVWRCRKVEAMANENAVVAWDVYHILSNLLQQLAQSDFQPAYTADESARLTEIHKRIQAASVSLHEPR
jgi:hypothetical protein